MAILSVPHELTETPRERANGLGASGEEIRNFEYTLPGKPKLFVKRCSDNLAEASTQNFFYLCAQGDESAPRIPRVFDAFTSAEGIRVIVMENLEAPTLDDCGIQEGEAVKHAASAVRWLLEQLPSVPDTCLGRIPFKKAAVWHQVSKCHQSPRAFTNPEELAEYISKASQRCRSKVHLVSPELVLASFGERRCIYHSDIKKDKFLLDSNRVCIVDSQHIGVLPQVFQTFAFFNIGKPFAAAVGRELGYQPSSTAKAMVPISSVLQQCGGNARL